MTKALKANARPRAKSRMRSEIVEAMRGLRKVGAVSDGSWKDDAAHARQGRAAKGRGDVSG
jgi:hypothetical protein